MSSGILKNDSLFYDNSLGTPWHGLGTPVEGAKTSSEAIILAGLDWPVYKIPKMTQEFTTPEGIIIPSMVVEDDFSTIRGDTNEFVGKSLGERYQVFDNKACFQFFDQMVDEQLAMYCLAGSLLGGKKIWLLAKLPENLRVNSTDDIVEEYILLATSHDGSMGVQICRTPVRVVCQNTLNVALSNKGKYSYSMRHTPNMMEKVKEARTALNLAKDFYLNLNVLINEFANYQVSQIEVDNYVKKLFPDSEKKQEEAEEKDMELVSATRTINNRNTVIDLFENGNGNDMKGIKGSAWALFNGVTQYSDYYRGTRSEEDSDKDDARLNSVWFGTSQKLKNTAFQLTKELVGVN